MQACTPNFDQYEDNLLNSCWKVGAIQSRTARFSLINKNEINAVDVVACCKRITTLIEKKTANLQRSNSVALRHRDQLNYSFKDIAQLTCGVTDIYSRQVDNLLGDTKLLLDQMKGSTFDLVLTTKKSVIRTNRKRKRVITKETQVTICKHPRLVESELLNRSVREYYVNMLSECQLWQSECADQQVDLQESIELPRNRNQSNSYHAITITEEFEIHEESTNIYPSDGFGDSGEVDLTLFHDLYPSRGKQRESSKRRSTIDDPTDILPAKMSRLDGDIVEVNISQADSAIMTSYNGPAADSIDQANITYIVCEPSLPFDFSNPPSPKMSCDDSVPMPTSHTNSIEPAELPAPKNTAKNPRKKKLIIDKCIEYSRDKLMKDRIQYLENHRDRVVIIPKPSERRKSPEDLLSKLGNLSFIFPDIMRNYRIHLTKEEMEAQSEVTLRSIFGDEFTKDLVKEIFVPVKGRKNEEKEIVAQENPAGVTLTPPLPLFIENNINNNSVTPPLPPFVESNNNNNNSKYTISLDRNNFDAFSVMMDLLTIWRNNPEIKEIDANKFIKSYSDRIKASLAFNFLLCLVRDKFIVISKKPNSIEMNGIALGPESNRLIESLTQDEMF